MSTVFRNSASVDGRRCKPCGRQVGCLGTSGGGLKFDLLLRYLGWDPSLRLNLDSTHLPEHLQARQQRATEEYVQQHRQSSQQWSWGLQVLGLGLGLIFTAFTLLTSGFGFAFALNVVHLVGTLGSLLITRLQEQLQQDTARTEEEKQSAQDTLSLLQGILGLVGLLVCWVDLTRLGIQASVANGAALIGQVAGIARFTRLDSLLRAVTSVLGRVGTVMPSALRLLQLPSLLRTVDRFLSVFGVNGARLSQLGMTSWTRVWAAILELLNSAFTLFRSLLNLFQRQTQQNTRRENEKTEAKSEEASQEFAENKVKFKTKDGAEHELVRQSADTNANIKEEYQEANEFQGSQNGKGRPPPKRKQAEHLRYKYTPPDGEHVEIWFEGSERRTGGGAVVGTRSKNKTADPNA